MFESIDPLSLEHPPRGYSAFAYKRLADGAAFLEWLDAIQFIISADGRHITFHASEHADRRLVFDFLIAQAMSVALLNRGIESLHATAVEVAGRAVALIGDCGYGKSTLAAACLQAGARLITDDLLVLAREGSDYCVLPGAQRIKLTPQVARETIGDRPGVAMDDARGKFIYPLSDTEFCDKPVILDRILVLRPDSASYEMKTLEKPDAFHELLQATFNPLDSSPQRLRRNMDFNSMLAASVSVLSVSVPWNSRLKETARLVMNA